MTKCALPPLRRMELLALLRTAERIDLDEPAWLAAVVASARRLLPGSDNYAAFCAELVGEERRIRYATELLHSELRLHAADAVNTQLSTEVRASAFALNGIIGLREQAWRIRPMMREAAARGIHELVNVNAGTPSASVMIHVHVEHEIRPSAAERHAWQRISAHLGSALQLRRSLATLPDPTPEVVFDDNGRCAHASANFSSTMLDRLRSHVLERERLRRRGEDPPRLLASWTALVHDGWTIVDRFDADGRRWILAWDNPMGALDPRHLTERERRVLARAIEGWSNRDTADDLGVSPTATSRALQSARDKLGGHELGVLSRWRSLEQLGELLTLPLGIDGLHAIGIPTALADATERLTASERAIVPHLLRGSSNREIGHSRGTSERTVANQLRSIYDKLGVGSRRELVHLLSDRTSRAL